MVIKSDNDDENDGDDMTTTSITMVMILLGAGRQAVTEMDTCGLPLFAADLL